MLRLKDSTLLKTKAYIDGEWIGASQEFVVLNPANNEILCSVPELGANETLLAIKAANATWSHWRKKTAKHRAKCLNNWYNLVIQNTEDLARIITAEQGKPLEESIKEVEYGASFICWYAEEGLRMEGEIIQASNIGQKLLVFHEPIGVVGAITPWNFPVAMITRKASAAMAAGCTVIVKPAEDTPLSALALAELAQRAQIPNGVFNIITSSKPEIVTQPLISNNDIGLLSFTGSSEVGKSLMSSCGQQIKNISMELGGNAPFIVFEDADIEQAVAGAVAAKFRNTGQTCICANRIIVHQAVYDRFVSLFVKAVSHLSTGPGLHGKFDLGPLINHKAFTKVNRIVTDALTHNATLLYGKTPHKLGGQFMHPVVLGDITSKMLCYHEEIFGPVAPILRFDDEEQAMQISNDTRSGLAAYFYTKDLSRIFRVSQALECGIIGVNESIVSTETAPFGGYKESGIGREGGKYGLKEFLETKYVLLGGLSL